MQNKVTICVPVYGVEQYIERCARSLFEQTYSQISYIFVDDCTPDNSIIVLKKVIEDYPSRKDNVRIIKHQNNLGLAGARNTAVANCDTEFIVHVDSDDYIDLNTIEECLKNQEKTGADIVTYGVKRIRNGIINTVIYDWSDDKVEMTKRLLRHKIGHGVCGRMIRTSLYHDNNIKVEVGRGMSEDFQVTPRLFYYAETLTYISNVFYYYYLDNDNSYVASFSIDKFRDQMAAANLIKTFFHDHVDYLDAISESLYKSLTNSIKACARANAKKIEYREVRDTYEHLPKKYYDTLDFPTKVAIKIKNYTLLKMYISFAWHIKKALKKAK